MKQESLFAVLTQEKVLHGPPMYGEDLTTGLDTLARDFDQIAIPAHGRYVQ